MDIRGFKLINGVVLDSVFFYHFNFQSFTLYAPPEPMPFLQIQFGDNERWNSNP